MLWFEFYCFLGFFKIPNKSRGALWQMNSVFSGHNLFLVFVFLNMRGAGFPQTRKTLWKSVNQKTASASKHCFLAQASFLKKLGSVLSVNASISFAGGTCRQAVCRPFTWPKGVAVAVFPLTL